MNKSEQINELAAALAKAQAEIQIAVRNIANNFFKSQFADLEECVRASRPALTKHGLSVTQLMDTSENGMVLETVLMHSSGQWISSVWPVNPLKPDPQAIMSATTYARRGAYNAITGTVPGNDDDDGNAASGNKEGMISQMMSAETSTEANLTRLGYLKKEGREAAEGGMSVLMVWWKRQLPSDQKNLLKYKDEELKKIAEEADQQHETA